MQRACDAALASKNNALKLANLALTEARTQNAALASANAELNEARASIFSNPFFLVVFGAAVGAASFALVKR